MPNDKRSTETLDAARAAHGRKRRVTEDTGPQRVVGFIPPVQIAPAVFRRARTNEPVAGIGVVVHVDARMTEGARVHVTVERSRSDRRVRVDIRTRSRYRWGSGSFMGL